MGGFFFSLSTNPLILKNMRTSGKGKWRGVEWTKKKKNSSYFRMRKHISKVVKFLFFFFPTHREGVMFKGERRGGIPSNVTFNFIRACQQYLSNCENNFPYWGEAKGNHINYFIFIFFLFLFENHKTHSQYTEEGRNREKETSLSHECHRCMKKKNIL